MTPPRKLDEFFQDDDFDMLKIYSVIAHEFSEQDKANLAADIMNHNLRIRCAAIANAILSSWIKENGVRVYGNKIMLERWFTEPYKRKDDTHSAILLDITPIAGEAETGE